MGVRERIGKTARDYIGRGDPTGWFEQVYADAAGDPSYISWADLRPHPHLTSWLGSHAAGFRDKLAMVVGCGLGDDAEYLASQGLRVTAFDISPSAIAWCKQRFPATAVDYVAANALDLPEAWHEAFDLVVEIYTLQTLVSDLRAGAARAIAGCVNRGGTLLVIARAREASETFAGPPWPLTKAELDAFEGWGLRCQSFEDRDDVDGRHFRATYRR